MKLNVLILTIISYELAVCLPSENRRATGCEVSTALFAGNEAEAIRLLELGFNASTPDQYGRTAMHLAAEQGFLKVIQLLIEKGYKYQIHSKTTFNQLPLNDAVQKQNYEITELLIKMGSDINVQEMKIAYSPLMKAVLLNNERITKLLLDSGADIYTKQSYGLTARSIADNDGNWKIVHLIDAYASVRTRPKSEETCEFRLCRECGSK